MQEQSTVLRKSLRLQRRHLNCFQHRQAEQKIIAEFLSNSHFRFAKKIGIYLSAFGEVDTNRLIHLCFKLGKSVYLPRVSNLNGRLKWVEITLHQYLTKKFSKHTLGMYEPKNSIGITAKELDVLIMPLLACDQFGTRMGMGGGYYDRTLSLAPRKPYRIGIAHDFQVISEKLERHAWDQPLDQLITPNFCLKFKRQLLINK